MWSKLRQRWDQKFASDHGGHSLVDLVLYKSYEWEWIHSNQDSLEEYEPDLSRIDVAGELYNSGNILESLQIYFELAGKGSIWSMYEIGQYYEYGRGVSIDSTEAEKWFKMAFANGSQPGMLRCAHAAASRQDFTACEDILKVGVDQDWAPAIFWLAWYKLAQSTDKATYQAILPSLRKAANYGHPAAKLYLGNFMVRGKFGVLWIPLGLLNAVRFGMANASV